MANENCVSAKEVYQAELTQAINPRRRFWKTRARNQRSIGDQVQDYPESDGSDLVGVALSGGGIRSAMFNLGLLQSFQKAGLMKHVDYLASVSGGGYTNGYYSTLGHFANPDASTSHSSHTTDSNSQADQLNRLSARDAQFLLDGQYLNRPIEFMTSYLVRTVCILVTALAATTALACLVALFFRLFDLPSVRVWLGLLNVDTDLRVGLLSCAVAGVLGVLILLLWRMVRYIRQTPGRNVPGQWAVIMLAAFASGCAIMIGNGDFAISSGDGWLPQKLDLSSWQIPLAIVVLLFFSPVFRVSSLLKSEKVNATVWQKVILYLVLGCTTWGAFLCLVGLIGQENVSGFVSHRPPSFVDDDVVTAQALVDSMKNETSGLGSVVTEAQRQQLSWITYQQVVEQETRVREQLMQPAVWHPWLSRTIGPTVSRWMDTVGSYVSNDDSGMIRSFIKLDQERRELERQVMSALEERIRPDTAAAAAQRHALTAHLLQLAAMRIERFEGDSESSSATSDTSGDSAETRPGTSDQLAIVPARSFTSRRADQVLADWMHGPAQLVTTNGQRYRDLGLFRTLFERCWSVDKRWDTSQLTDFQQWQLNRMLLEIGFPTAIKQRAMVSTPVVIWEDQQYRLFLLVISSLIAAVGLFALDVNGASAWFRFYRRRIGETFLAKADAGGLRPLYDLTPQQHGYPYPLFVAAMILPQAPTYHGPSHNKSKRANPTKLDESFASDWYSFLLSPMFCGWLPSGTSGIKHVTKSYLPTDQYMDGTLQVDEAIVLSGAAVTPFMAKNASLQLLMHLFNVRLEQWLPNPRLLRQPQHRRFSLCQMAGEFLRSREWDADSWHYGVVADGGFREFLGVEELITRRCKVIIVSDAGCNNGLYEFGVLAELIRKLRLDHCVEVLDLDHDRPLDTRRLKRCVELEGRSPQHFVLGRIRYPERIQPMPNDQVTASDVDTAPYNEGLLVYVQMSLTGDEDIDIEQFRRTNPSFPDEPISNQFYTRDQVESFRQLGEHIGKLLCRDIDPFDCSVPDRSAKEPVDALQLEHRLRLTRIRKLQDGFRSSYRNECRQEAMNSTDDVGIGWFLKQEHISYSTLCQIQRYENSTEHQSIVRDYVWHALEMIDPVEEELLRCQLKPADIFGMAIECNRRHAGFRPEWPTAFFQVGGRDLLVKAAEVAELLLAKEEIQTSFQSWIADQSETPPALLMSLSRLAVMLPRGVFRLRGTRTSAELIACILNYILPAWGKDTVIKNWVSNARAQSELRRAIATGMASAVTETLLRLAQQPAQLTGHPVKRPGVRRNGQRPKGGQVASGPDSFQGS